jgi:hypothetical protein
VVGHCRNLQAARGLRGTIHRRRSTSLQLTVWN